MKKKKKKKNFWPLSESLTRFTITTFSFLTFVSYKSFFSANPNLLFVQHPFFFLDSHSFNLIFRLSNTHLFFIVFHITAFFLYQIKSPVRPIPVIFSLSLISRSTNTHLFLSNLPFISLPFFLYQIKSPVRQIPINFSL